MMTKKPLILLFMVLALVGLGGIAYPQGNSIGVASSVQRFDAASYLAQIRNNKNTLRAFMRLMPKGGELHTHLSGIPSPEDILSLAVASQHYDYYVRIPKHAVAKKDDPQDYALVAVMPGTLPKEEEGVSWLSAAKLRTPTTPAEQKLLADFHRAHIIEENEPDPLKIFFGAIFQRRALVANNSELVPKLVANTVRQAHHNHMQYIELQLSPFPLDPLGNVDETNRVINLTAAREYLTILKESVKTANQAFPPDEQVEVRFILSFSRVSRRTFLSLPLAFELAASNDAVADSIAGINLVGNEYAPDGMGQSLAGPEHFRDFLSTLHRLYPQVRLTIHAGEGNQWDWHIRDTLLLGAERIGHGTNLSLSPDSIEKDLMRRNHVLVEACVTSNNLLLGIPLNKHPFIDYLRSGIAVSLNSDDGGIFSTDLSEEFARVIEYYPSLKWEELKQMAKASLEHAFVSDQQRQALIAHWEQQMQRFEAPKDPLAWQLELGLATEGQSQLK